MKRTLAPIALAVLLAGCASQTGWQDGLALFDQGRTEQGLAKLEEAARRDPHDLALRSTLLSRKLMLATGLNSRAESARQQGNTEEAERLSQQVLAMDPANPAASQRLAGIAQDRRHKQQIAEAEASFKRGGDSNLNLALETLRPVLAENPGQRDASALRNRIADEQARARPGGRLSAAFRKPVTLEFRDASLRSVFDFIGKVAGLNFVFDKDVDPNLRATISVRDTSIEDAIALLLNANQLEQSVSNERSVLIYPNTPQKLKDYQQLAVRSFFLANGDVKTVAYTIKTLLKARDLVTDERLGVIMMRDTPEMIRMAEKIIAVQDVADPEVMLEVEVMEVKRSRLSELGLAWPGSASFTAIPSGALAQLTVGDIGRLNSNRVGLGLGSVTLNASSSNGDSNILANPRIRVRNKEKAKVLIGDRVPVITVTTNQGVSSDSVNYVDVGLKLDVEPNIYLDDEVAIRINLEVSSVVKEVVSKSGTQAYQIGTRSAGTVLRLKDGETQVLAGLISDEDRKSASRVPAIGDLPILNRLFGSQKDDVSRSEIVLSITPHVVRSVRRPEMAVAQFDSGTESVIGGRGGSPAADTAPPPAGPSAPPPPPRAPSPMTGMDSNAAPPTDKGPGADAPKKGQ